jgi:hypothetical protein
MISCLALARSPRGCTPPHRQSRRGPHPLAARLLAGPPLAASLCRGQSTSGCDDARAAVRVDPPESIVDLTGADPLVPLRITALVVDATFSNLFEYGDATRVTNYQTTVHICVPPPISQVNAPPGCPVGSLFVAQLAAIPDETTPLIYTPPLSLLRAALAQDPLNGLTGIRLILELDIDADVGTISMRKELNYQLKGSPLTINHAIELIGIETSKAGVHTTLAGNNAAQILVGMATGLRPWIGPGDGADAGVETYLAYDNHGALVQLEEHVTYAFYGGNELFFGAPDGSGRAIYTGAAGDVADEPVSGSADPPNGVATVEGDFQGPHSGYFWVVARDGRGGVAWREIGYQAQDLRVCWVNSGQCPAIFFGCN